MKEAIRALLQVAGKWSIEIQALLFMSFGLALIFLYQSHYRRTLENKEQARQVVEYYLRISEAFDALQDESAGLSLHLAKLGAAPDSALVPEIEVHILRLQEKAGRLISLLPVGGASRDSLKLFMQHRLEQASIQMARWRDARPPDRKADNGSGLLAHIRSSLLDKKAADIHLLHREGQAHDQRDQWFNFFISLTFSIVIFLAVFAVFRGVNRDRKAGESLNQALEAAESAARAKEQFLANMSHEIRTPLNAILGYSSMLADTNLEAGQREFARGIETAGGALLSIVNDILDLSKLEAGMVRFEAIPFQLESVMQSIGQMFRHQAREKRLWLHIHPMEDVLDTVIGDPTRLAQMLANLISNGIKFTSQGGVDVWVKNIREEDEVAWLSFKVQDTGIGIPRNKLDSIFERFEQASADTTRKYGGAGLGLSIVWKLAELQGGHVYVRSREGQGATFYLELPYRFPAEGEWRPPPPTEDGQPPSEPVHLEGLHILVAEDNPMNQHIAGLMLSHLGADCTIVENGHEALRHLQQQPFSLVLMDLQMPVMDGYAAAREIRRLGIDVPIIAITAHAMPGEREKCLACGMNDYLSKPVRRQELRQAIQRNLPRPATPVGKGPSDGPAIDYDYLMEVAGGSKTALAELAGIFLAQAPQELEKLGTALQENDLSGLAATAHSMKSTVSYMGMEQPLGQLLKRLELAARAEAPDTAHLSSLLEEVSRMTEQALRKVREELLPLREE